MSVDWNKLRTLDSSQRKAFEELCCQLAAYEEHPPGATFIRKGDPDAGIECYWCLENGDEWGWQAKFFLRPPDDSQWQQIDNSVRTALNKHSKLTHYTVCIPIDRPDPRIKLRKSFMDRWNDHATKWQQWARDRGMSVEFVYWGKSEIIERLSREEHRGRSFFWFGDPIFSKKWLNDQVADAIANAGPRYTPELNVELPIAYVFDGLGRTPDYYNRFQDHYARIKQTYHQALSRKAEEAVYRQFITLQDNIGQLLGFIEKGLEFDIRTIPFDSIRALASKSGDAAQACIRQLEQVLIEEKQKADLKDKDPNRKKASKSTEGFGAAKHFLYELADELYSLKEFCETIEVQLTNTQFLLLVSDAGLGKTHVFCDVAQMRVGAALPTVLFLGGHFNNTEPWAQMIHLLGLSCDRDQFLGALEAAAQAANTKALIMIDALNEGDGKDLWKNYLAGIINILSRYPWIALAISVRSSYEDMIIPSGLVPEKLVRATHYGFAGLEYQATKEFFTHYGIKSHRVPILKPEFQNPQFLKLFCEGISNRGLTAIPPGLNGITSIYEYFIQSINDKLAHALDFDPRERLVQAAVNNLSELMANRKRNWLPRAEARNIVNTLLPGTSYEESLFRNMISEGVLLEDRFPSGQGQRTEGIHFSYERFADHLIAKYLLDRHLDSADPAVSFHPGQPLEEYVSDEQACWQNRGIIEAFAIQLPERTRMELPDIAKQCKDFPVVIEAFVDSLVWRDTSSISDGTFKYINEEVMKYRGSKEKFLDALLMIATEPDHPLNAEFLHAHLMNFEMADRDAWWSIFIHEQYGQQGAVDRLLEWAWASEDKSHIDDVSIQLCATALIWFLTTSNRFLRDKTTKVLVRLLTDRIHLVRRIIDLFIDANDPYILERLYAVAYGCTMRSNDNDAIAELAQAIYHWVFTDGTPPPHILLRDYARGVIELAMHRGMELDIDPKMIRPPYRSEWPEDIPSEEEIKKYGNIEKDMPQEEWARVHLYHSVMGFEDFARYIIGTNSPRFEWSSRRLNAPHEPSRKEVYEEFIQSLTEKEETAWEQYHELRLSHEAFEIISKSGQASRAQREIDMDGIKSRIEEYEQHLLQTLSEEKSKVFRNYVTPYLNDPDPFKDEFRFDLGLVQRLIFKKVLDLGWTMERFGWIDSEVFRDSYAGRTAHKVERIGKKYQWIAYHEVLARVSDNFEFRNPDFSEEKEDYQGPWQLGLRDIDPSCLIPKTRGDDWEPTPSTWWSPIAYREWNETTSDVEWIRKRNDLPSPASLIEVSNTEVGSSWLTMEGYYHWEQPTTPGVDRYDQVRREIWYMLKSYIVKKSEMAELWRWAGEQHFWGHWMPESHGTTDIYLGEFFWAPSFKHHDTAYYHHDGWIEASARIPNGILVSTDQYFHESSGYDCSIEKSINIYMPAKWLSEALGLKWIGVEGCLLSEDGDLVAIDPSIGSEGPGALLINKEYLLKKLDDAGYDVIWTILGEKRVSGGGLGRNRIPEALEISGAFRIRNNKVEGALTTRLISPENDSSD